MAKMKKQLLFSKSTGVMIGEIDESTDTSSLNLHGFDIKNVEIDETEYWHGDFATGKILSRVEKPVILESMIRYSSNVKALTEWPIHKQLNVLIDMLDKSAMEKTTEFVEMKAFLDKIRQEHKEKVEIYSKNSEAYTWVSQEEESLQISKKTI